MSRLQSYLALGVSLCVGIAMLATKSALAAEKPEKVVVANQPLVATPLGAMKEQGWFERAAGVPVEWGNFSSGADVNTAFIAGAVDIGLVGLPVFVSGLAQGVPYRLISLLDIPGTADGLAVRNDAGIETIADVKGKRIGVPFGSGADYMLQGALKVNGLSSDDVTLINLQPQPIVAAWATKQIDAAFIWAPILTTLLEQDGKLIVNDGEMAKKGYFAGDVAIVSDKFAKQYPEVVQAWVNQNLRAVNWVNANGPGAYQSMMKEYELTPDQLKAGALPPATSFPTKEVQLSDQWMGNNADALIKSSMQIGDFLVANKMIAKAPTKEQLSKGIDSSFLEKAAVPAAPQ